MHGWKEREFKRRFVLLAGSKYKQSSRICIFHLSSWYTKEDRNRRFLCEKRKKMWSILFLPCYIQFWKKREKYLFACGDDSGEIVMFWGPKLPGYVCIYFFMPNMYTCVSFLFLQRLSLTKKNGQHKPVDSLLEIKTTCPSLLSDMGVMLIVCLHISCLGVSWCSWRNPMMQN